mgnify:CR=1 FL=1
MKWLSPARFQQHDQLIRAAATANQLDPMLLKAVVWQESRFDPQKLGAAGERGLMQVSEIAAREWAKEHQRENFQVEELFDPATNLEGRRLVSAPRGFALATNARSDSVCARGIQCRAESGATLGGGEGTKPISASVFQRNIDFPGTKKYIQSILERYHFYQRRGRM